MVNNKVSFVDLNAFKASSNVKSVDLQGTCFSNEYQKDLMDNFSKNVVLKKKNIRFGKFLTFLFSEKVKNKISNAKS